MENLRDSANKIALMYERACGVRCSVTDASCPDGIDMRMKDPFCSLCAHEQLKKRESLKCENIHRDGIYQAEKWGGKYEYLCPAGLAFICAAIESGETGLGITAGPFLMVELKDFLGEDLEKFFPEGAAKKLIAHARDIPYIYSGRVSSLADMLSALAAYAAKKESLQLMIMRQIAKSQNEMFYSVCDMSMPDMAEYPIEQEKLLQGYIAQGNKAASQRVLNDILGHIFFCSGGSFEYIKARITELIVILSRAAIQGGADIAEVFGLNSDYISRVQSFGSFDELNQWLSKVLVRFTNSVFDYSEAKYSELVKKAVAFIRSNYMNKISLNDISNYTNISVSHLSKIFKEEMKCSLSAYINQVRVENAKLFLMGEGIPLTEVAYLSGFEDQSYFSKVFKKVTGATPGKFRARRGNI